VVAARTDDPGHGAVRIDSTPQAISPARCLELLATISIGRLAWRAVDGLQLLPVSYVPYQSGVAFRTSPYGLLSDLVQRTEVVFEADQLDPETRSGWSVIMRGTAEAVAEPRELVTLWTVDGLTPWAGGVRNLFIQVTARETTGRVYSEQSRPKT
jgi:uncharacterized protein